MKKIAIIGGGSSGLFLANLLKNLDVQVCIFEKNNKLGKKILASGNGKCNFTNIAEYRNKYNCKFANTIIDKFNVEKTIEFFEERGLVLKHDLQGRCYPVSECASSVLDCLKLGLDKFRILLESEVKDIKVKDDGYLVEYNDLAEYFDFVICCSGSKASNLGSDKAYQYLNKLKVSINDLKSSLVPVVVYENVSKLKGLRIKCLLKLLDENNDVVYVEDGEVLFKDDGLSGIAVFNASSYINRKNSKYKIVLDLSLGMNKDKLFNYIYLRKKNSFNVFKGYLNDKLAEYILEVSGVKTKEIDDYQINKIIDNIVGLEFNVKRLYSLVDAQVCSGGLSLEELTENLELKRYKNIYVCGELMDVDGVSGGYNLQFAWSSAGVVFEDIKKKIKN